MNIREQKRVIYTVITDGYDHLFPPMADQPGWDMICFSDRAFTSKFWDVRPIPDLPELKGAGINPVRTARLLKILPHRFLSEYDCSVYIDANRVLDDSLDDYIARFGGKVLCFGSIAADAYAAAETLLEQNDGIDPFDLAPVPALSKEEKSLLKKQVAQWKKAKLPENGGCPGTAVLFREHNDKTVVRVMESWAKQLLAGCSRDEPAFPFACFQHRFRWTEGLSQFVRKDDIVSPAEELAVVMPHLKRMTGGLPLREESYPENPPPPGGEYDGYPLLLTVGVPVSNQIKTIRRCLTHLKPLLDAIPSELVVVDTGSTDGTVEVCREFGARVIPFPWINDMSAARNQALRAAKGLWYLSVDDDEWFEDVSPMIRFFRTGEYKKYVCGFYFQRNYSDSAGTAFTDFAALRLIRITPDLHFEGRIHDALVGGVLRGLQSGAAASVRVYANHFGFAADEAVEKKPKALRNIRILKLDLAQYPRNTRYGYQMMRELTIIGRNRDTYRIAYYSLSQDREKEKSDLRMRLGAAVYCLYNCQLMGASRQAIRFADRYAAYDTLDTIGRCNVAKLLSSAYLNLREYRLCERYAEEYDAARKRFLSLPESERELQERDLGSLYSLDNSNYALSVKREQLDAVTMLQKRSQTRKLLCGDPLFTSFFDDHKYRNSITERLCRDRNWDHLKALFSALEKEKKEIAVQNLLAQIDRFALPEDFSDIRRVFGRSLDPHPGFLALLRLRESVQPLPDNVYDAVFDFAAAVPFDAGNLLRVSLLSETFRLQRDPRRALSLMDVGSVDFLMLLMSDFDERTFLLYQGLAAWQAEVTEASDDVLQYLAMRLSRLILEKASPENDAEGYFSLFERYIHRRYAWASKLYAPDVLREDRAASLLDANMQGICFTRGAFKKLGEKDYVGALQSVRNALEKDPDLKEGLELLRLRITKEAKREQAIQNAAANEFTALFDSVKRHIEQLIDAGQLAVVPPLIAQLEQIAPDHRIVKELKQKAGLS